MRRVAGEMALGIMFAASVLMADDEPSSRWTVLRQGFSHLGNVTRGSAISADGRFVAFVSDAGLLSADTNSRPDIYVFDRLREALTLETVAADGSASNGASSSPALNGDGRSLVFESTATNLTAPPGGDPNRRVFFRDRLSGATRCISVRNGAPDVDHASETPAISDDGRFVAFASSATNLDGPDANGTGRDIYLVRIDTGEVRRVSVDTEGQQSSIGQSFLPSLSGDGSVVAFTSTAPLDHDARQHLSAKPAVYVHDMASGTTRCASCGRRGRDIAVGGAYDPHVSRNGRFVAFTVTAGSGREPRRTDVALHDRTSSDTTLITDIADASSARPRISGDARFVVFESLASNLACHWRCSADKADENLLSDIYLFDRQQRRFTRVSGATPQWWAPSIAPALDADGKVVVFSSRQPFGPEDRTADFDLFVSLLGERSGYSRRGPAR